MTDSRLIIMRHAKSDWNSQVSSDFDRPLARRGERDGMRMGNWLRQHNIAPDCFVSSPARRARQTSELVAEGIKYPAEDITWIEQVYAASLSELLEVISAYSADVSCLLLVGHNPGLDDLLSHLASEQPSLSVRGKLMTTAAVAVLNFGSNAISTVPGSATLDTLARPKELAD